MINKVKIPSEFSESIRKKGNMLSQVNKEICGVLLGSYEDEVITATEILTLPFPKNAYYVGQHNLYNELFPLLNAPWEYQLKKKFIQNSNKLIKERKVPGVIVFHSHPGNDAWLGSSWSMEDRAITKKFKNKAAASLLYRADIDEFEALNGEERPVLVDIINRNGKVIETLGDQTPPRNPEEDTIIDKPCIYQIKLQTVNKFGNRKNYSTTLQYDVTFNPGIAKESPLIFEMFMHESYKKMGVLGEKSRNKHLEIKREDCTIVLKY